MVDSKNLPIRLGKATDPLVAIISAIFGILGVLGLLSKWGLTADQVAELGGFLLSAAAAIRTWITRSQAKAKESQPRKAA